MRKGLLVRIAVLLVVLLLASISAVSAQPDEPGTIECVQDNAYDGNPQAIWSGTVSRCSLAGAFESRAAAPSEIVGKTMHFSETFTIWPDSGGEIHGVDQGVWNFSTLKFRVNGWVTDASPEWAHMVGYKMHVMGWTSDPSVFPITVEDAPMRFAPANRPS